MLIKTQTEDDIRSLQEFRGMRTNSSERSASIELGDSPQTAFHTQNALAIDSAKAHTHEHRHIKTQFSSHGHAEIAWDK